MKLRYNKHESLVTESTTLEANLNSDVKALDAGSVITESSETKSDMHDTSNSSRTYITHVVDANIRPVNDQVPSAEVHLTVLHNVLATEQYQAKSPLLKAELVKSKEMIEKEMYNELLRRESAAAKPHQCKVSSNSSAWYILYVNPFKERLRVWLLKKRLISIRQSSRNSNLDKCILKGVLDKKVQAIVLQQMTFGQISSGLVLHLEDVWTNQFRPPLLPSSKERVRLQSKGKCSEQLQIGKGNILQRATEVAKNPIFYILVDISRTTITSYRPFTASQNFPSILHSAVMEYMTHDAWHWASSLVTTSTNLHGDHKTISHLSLFGGKIGARDVDVKKGMINIMRLSEAKRSISAMFGLQSIPIPSRIKESEKSPKGDFQNQKGERECSLQHMNRTKTANRNPTNYHLYLALMEALIADEKPWIRSCYPSKLDQTGRSAKREDPESAASGSAQPPSKDDHQSSKKPREHPALTSTGWQITDTRDDVVNSLMHMLPNNIQITDTNSFIVSKKRSSDSSKKLKGIQTLTPAEQEAADIMKALKESKKMSKRQPGTGGSNEGTGNILGVPDESTVISRASSEGTGSKPGVPDEEKLIL
ncbi:hypothetical protein Tco_0285698 [Tanacetum coccineum]